MTLEYYIRRLNIILANAYVDEPSIRHDPLYKAVTSFKIEIQKELDAIEDDANWQAFQKWQTSHYLDHSACPDDGPCLINTHTGHTTAF